MKVVFAPAPGKVVVRKATIETDAYITKSGFILIEQSGLEQANYGIIEAIYEPFIDPNDDETTEPFFTVGDRVVFGKHSGITVQIGRERFLILRETEILTKLSVEEHLELERAVDIRLPADYAAVSQRTSAIRNFEDQNG